MSSSRVPRIFVVDDELSDYFDPGRYSENERFLREVLHLLARGVAAAGSNAPDRVPNVVQGLGFIAQSGWH
jgi:hypothetical protein